MLLTPQMEQVLALVSAGSTVSDAAQSAGIHRNTVYNWLRSAPAFRHALANAREAKAVYWHEQAEQHAAEALDTIRALMSDPGAPASVRLKAAQTILNLATNPIFVTLPNPAQSGAGDLVARMLRNSAQSPAPDVSVSDPLAPTDSSLDVPNSAQPLRRAAPKIGRNDLCPCGSGKKFKRCCLNEGSTQAGEPTAA